MKLKCDSEKSLQKEKQVSIGICGTRKTSVTWLICTIEYACVCVLVWCEKLTAVRNLWYCRAAVLVQLIPHVNRAHAC